MAFQRKLLRAALLVFTAIAARGASLQFDGSVFRIEGWQAAAEPAGGWVTIFTVRVEGQDAPPMLGAYAVENGALVFRPRFAIREGVGYLAVAALPNGEKLSGVFEKPRRELHSEARVERIYPTIDVLPANVLKLYIHFSAPMSKGEAWQHIRLLDADGKVVPLVFLEIEQELWDAGGRRLTVLFDPGRIKRGLAPTNDLGSPVTEGRSYRLVIDKAWHDARGVELVAGFEKRFTGGPSDRTPPSVDRWKIEAPRAGTSEALVVRFPKPMDAALLQRMIRVDGVEGAITIGDFEREWRFVPTSEWKAGAYRLSADNTLEDIAGNHLDRAFDVDLKATARRETISTGTTFRSFVIN